MWKYNTVDELYHHGIKGQKWGVRRYQNEDGTLTDEGRQRYLKIRNMSLAVAGTSAVVLGALAAKRIRMNYVDKTIKAGKKVTSLSKKAKDGSRFLVGYKTTSDLKVASPDTVSKLLNKEFSSNEKEKMFKFIRSNMKSETPGKVKFSKVFDNFRSKTRDISITDISKYQTALNKKLSSNKKLTKEETAFVKKINKNLKSNGYDSMRDVSTSSILEKTGRGNKLINPPSDKIDLKYTYRLPTKFDNYTRSYELGKQQVMKYGKIAVVSSGAVATGLALSSDNNLRRG